VKGFSTAPMFEKMRRNIMNPLIITAVIYGGKKIASKISPAMLKEGARLAFKFTKDTKSREVSGDTKSIKLNQKVDIVENHLSVPKNYIEKQALRITQDITDDLSIIKGQNEILFLSNSIDYFLKGHVGRTGIDRGISYALQYDMAAVINHIRNNPSLRFPGYMLHQCTALAATIKEYNIFYDSILSDGHVKNWTQESVSEEMNRKYGPHREGNPVAPYMPYEFQVNWIRENKPKNASKWPIKLPFFGSNDEILDEAHDSLMILSKELITSEALEYRVIEKLAHLPEQKLTVFPVYL